jgi:8-oxo-dGTP diphosphatase
LIRALASPLASGEAGKWGSGKVGKRGSKHVKVNKMIRVTAGILEDNGKVLLAKRKKDDPLKDKWEFPGGKIEEGETPEACLKRELHEELGIDAEIGEFLISNKHTYDHLSVELFFFRVNSYTGDITPIDHEEIAWVKPSDFHNYDFPEADKPILDLLRTSDQ